MQYNDPRYERVRCSTCGKEWQIIDFGCALHVFFCSDPKVMDADKAKLRVSIPNIRWEA